MIRSLVLSIVFALPTPTATQEAVESWHTAIEWLRAREERLSADLDSAHSALLGRAGDDEALRARLQPEPPSPAPVGYSLVPRVTDHRGRTEVRVREQRYSIAELPGSFARSFVDARLLAERVSGGAGDSRAELEPDVAEFERLRKRHESLDEHLTYHEWWQAAVVDDADYFAERNRVVALVRRWRAAVDAGDSTAAELELEVRGQVAPFTPTPGLALAGSSESGLRLPVTVHTDITDETFLGELQRAVDDVWNGAPAMLAAGLSIELRIVVHEPSELYAESGTPPPERGAELDLEAHLKLFPAGALLVTTGARSTHARVGRYLQLGSRALSRTTLAHEFGHLLGFSDAYLRGFDGTPDDPYGAILIEWRGLVDDLMGNSGGGTVGEAMVAELLQAYSCPPQNAAGARH